MTIHKLKTIPGAFKLSWDVLKPFEIRNTTDRFFQKGDTVVLQEYDIERCSPHYTNEFERYTGREITGKISCVISYEQKEGFVVFGIKDIGKYIR